jgi:FkbM family methyltransferase
MANFLPDFKTTGSLRFIVRKAVRVLPIPLQLRVAYLTMKHKARVRTYDRLARRGRPVEYRLSKGLIISLYPEGQVAQALFTRKFEEVEIGLTLDFLKPGMNVVDVGANIGLYSILADKIVGPTGRVWAFEPSHENHHRLIRNLKINNSKYVTAVGAALGQFETQLELKSDAGRGDGERYLLLNEGDSSNGPRECSIKRQGEYVHVTYLDSFMASIGETRVDFMKIDVEGFEYWVLRGAENVLRSNPDIMILFECNAIGTARAGHTQRDIFSYLRDLGHNIYAWNPATKSWSSSEEVILSAGRLWACRREEILPKYLYDSRLGFFPGD